MATKMYSWMFEAFGITGLMTSIPQAEKGHGAAKKFNGCKGALLLSS